MLTLKKALVDDGVITTVYEATHRQPGRRGTVLNMDVSIILDPRFGKTRARLVLDPELESLDSEAALDKLADWAERIAITIRHRGAAANLVPVFAAPLHPVEPAELTDISIDTED